ncbi:MAG: glycerol-3-phosphate 1-O-acyltransferase PlsY [Alphaproteobacteria bacterium]|nr:glycerol-3-phosphate 1-O-acyltransferase PlsY [Alphaproteobacteria bacterium]MDA8005096.1 glycerol-3-phosphate 1-O-acyltransferase PlsY [Alphaproteobacteria bacterium]MDA8012469.1 glycerol-3-phosphate 1-O-acyltransferase PlsY [Alphaproteobacteria bacterium]
MSTPLAATLILAGYLLGSVPWALLLVRWRLKTDIRTIGSGNVGANNVLRTGHKSLAAATLALDAAKGAVPVWITYAALGEPSLLRPHASVAEHTTIALVGFAAFLGHLYPVWLRFRGGKGVATGFGVIFAVYWPLAILMAVLWIGTTMVFRISSVSALAASAAGTLLALGNAAFHKFEEPGAPIYALLLLAMTALVFWRHRGNIGRLRRGEEPRIGRTHTKKDNNSNDGADVN